MPLSSLLELRGVSFAYPQRPLVLDRVDLSLAAGERLCVTGPNGAGKSTLLRLLVGLLKPIEGEVHGFGKVRRTEDEFHEVRCRAGLIFQDPDDQLFSPTVAEDVAFGPFNLGKTRDEAEALVDETLALLEIRHLRDRITHKLSGGEKRMVTLASVLSMKPDVLLLDEPTNALDEENQARLVETLRGLPQAMILISHDPDVRQQIATRTVDLRAGTLAPLSS